MRKEKAICPVCGAWFVKGRPQQVYCSAGCAGEAYKERKRKARLAERQAPETGDRKAVCAYCGNEFLKGKAGQKYCSISCVARAWHARKGHTPGKEFPIKQHTAKAPAQIEMPAKRVCHDCGRPTRNYRCDECWRKLRKGLEVPAGEEK